MTSAQMKANVDTLLDEVTGASAFVTSTETYQALADGQGEVIALFLSTYKLRKKLDPNIMLPYELESLLNDNTGNTQTTTIPSGFLDLISAQFDHDGAGGQKPCVISDLRITPFEEDNTFLAASATRPKVYIKSVSDVITIVFLPTISGGDVLRWTIHYIKSPTDIASGQEPILPATTHNAIVWFAVARLLEKDQRFPEAQGYYNQFLQQMKILLGV